MKVQSSHEIQASSHIVRANWRRALDMVAFGDHCVVVQRYGKPVAAIIPYEDYIALRKKLEFLRKERQ